MPAFGGGGGGGGGGTAGTLVPVRVVSSPRRAGRASVQPGVRVAPPDLVPLRGLVVHSPRAWRRGSVVAGLRWAPALPDHPPSPWPAHPGGIRRPGDDLARRRPGLARLPSWGLGPTRDGPLAGSLLYWSVVRRGRKGAWIRAGFARGSGYHIYSNDGRGGSIDYDPNHAVAAVTSPGWVSGPLAAGSVTSFGVRAFDSAGEEQNLDCAATIVIDADGNDITNRPASPLWYRAFATKGAAIKVEWTYPTVRGPAAPDEFHIYIGIGAPSYDSPAAIVPADAGLFSMFQVTLGGLTDGVSYGVAVRASNACGEDPGTDRLVVTADGTGPAAVDGLTATPIV